MSSQETAELEVIDRGCNRKGRISKYILKICLILHLPMFLETVDLMSAHSVTYYGVDNIKFNQFSFLKDSLGGNFALINLECDTLSWQKALKAAENNGIKVIIWPIGSGHQYTPWAWNGTSWDISEGIDILEYAESYVISGGEALLAVLMSHEPFWNDGNPFTTEQMKLLYSTLKNVAPHIKLFIYIGALAYFDSNPSTRIEDGIMDIAGIWRHCFGGAEGTCEEALQQIDNDYALIQQKNLNIQLFFAIQSFGIAGTNYKMPLATEMLNFGTEVCKKDKLDGIFWYPWDNPASYTEWLSKDRYDSIGGDRWATIHQLSDICVFNGVEGEKGQLPQFKLFQNYPNPFSLSTYISYQLPIKADVTLEIYDALGRKVCAFTYKDQIAGWYSVLWNHQNDNERSVSSGIYFYQLKINNKLLETKKLLLLR